MSKEKKHIKSNHFLDSLFESLNCQIMDLRKSVVKMTGQMELTRMLLMQFM